MYPDPDHQHDLALILQQIDRLAGQRLHLELEHGSGLLLVGGSRESGEREDEREQGGDAKLGESPEAIASREPRGTGGT